MAAVSALLLLFCSLFAGLRLSFCALAGLPVVATVLRCGRRQAFMGYAAAGIVSLFISPLKAPSVIFLALFGIYPLLKSLFESPRVPLFFSYILKFVFFMASVGLIMFFSLKLGLVPPEGLHFMGWVLPIGSLTLWMGLVAVIFLFAYDLALTRLIGFYMRRIQK